MRDGSIPPRRVRDPEALYAPRFDRGEYRTPMQWGEDKNADFSPRTPWLAVTKDVADANVVEQINTPACSALKRAPHATSYTPGRRRS